jgi:hypothetical protein
MTDPTKYYTFKYGATPFLTASRYHSWKDHIANLFLIDDSDQIVLGNEEAPASQYDSAWLETTEDDRTEHSYTAF